MTCSSPSSIYPPVCCVHTPSSSQEERPLLGYHSHAATSDLYNEKQGLLPTPTQDCRRQANSKSKLVKNVIGAVVLFCLIHALFAHSHNRRHKIDNSNSSSNGVFVSDVCKDHAINWDGPSFFSTTANKFRLNFGKGNMFAKVDIQTADVAEPQLKIVALVSPPEDDKDQSIDFPAHSVPGEKTVVKIDHLSLNMEITDDASIFDAHIWYDDHTVHTPNGLKYRACARLQVQVLMPTSYTHYGQVMINGNVIEVNAHSLDQIQLDQVSFTVGVGSVVVKDKLFSDNVVAVVKTGHVEIDSVEAASDHAPLFVVAESTTGHVTVNAKTKPANKAHELNVLSNTGAVQLNVAPASSSLSSKSALADLNIHIATSTGSVRSTVALESPEQILHLDASSNTGSVTSKVSDAFEGRFSVATKLGSSTVLPASGSESHIEYETQTSQVKIGSKVTKQGQSGSEGSIELKSSLGRVMLQFTN
ncbi:hypothetical protein BG004_005809 [Podila humilis]|nr:hypothetical protein BG004_005809 [Podila humilis]